MAARVEGVPLFFCPATAFNYLALTFPLEPVRTRPCLARLDLQVQTARDGSRLGRNGRR